MNCDTYGICIDFLKNVSFGGAKILETYGYGGFFTRFLDASAVEYDNSVCMLFAFDKTKDLEPIIDE